LEQVSHELCVVRRRGVAGLQAINLHRLFSLELAGCHHLEERVGLIHHLLHAREDSVDVEVVSSCKLGACSSSIGALRSKMAYCVGPSCQGISSAILDSYHSLTVNDVEIESSLSKLFIISAPICLIRPFNNALKLSSPP
jgi:hypothetical protein